MPRQRAPETTNLHHIAVGLGSVCPFGEDFGLLVLQGILDLSQRAQVVGDVVLKTELVLWSGGISIVPAK